MKLASAVDQANSASTPRQAARLYNSIEHELELGGDGSEESYEQGEQALGVLRSRFPGVENDAREVTEPPQLSRRAKTELGERRSRPAVLGAQTRRQRDLARRQPHRTPRERIAHATAIHARRSSSRAGRRFSQTGIPAAAESTAQLLMRTLGGLAGLSFLYLSLQPNGVKAFRTAGEVGTNAIGALVSPNVDPLQGIGRTGPATKAARTIGSAGQRAGAGAAAGAAAATSGVAAAGQAAASAALGVGAHKPTRRH